MRRLAVRLLALLGLLGALPGAAHATHDVGAGYHLLRVADGGAALVVACDVQVAAPPRLTALGPTGRVLWTAAGPADDRLADALCGDPAGLAALLPELPDLAAAVARYDLVRVPVFGATSPDGRHHLFFASDHTRADVELLTAGHRAPAARAHLRAKAGFASELFGVSAAWHPDGRFAYLVGRVAAGTAPACQVWKPILRTFRAPASVAPPLAPAALAARYLRWAGARNARCARARDLDACGAAEGAIRRALAIAPHDRAAQAALGAIPWP